MQQKFWRMQTELIVESSNTLMIEMWPRIFLKSTIEFRKKKIPSTFWVRSFYDIDIFLGRRFFGFCSAVETCCLRQWYNTWRGYFENANLLIKKIQTMFQILTISWNHVSGPSNQTQKETGKEHCRSILKCKVRLWLMKCHLGSERI